MPFDFRIFDKVEAAEDLYVLSMLMATRHTKGVVVQVFDNRFVVEFETGRPMAFRPRTVWVNLVSRAKEQA